MSNDDPWRNARGKGTGKSGPPERPSAPPAPRRESRDSAPSAPRREYRDAPPSAQRRPHKEVPPAAERGRDPRSEQRDRELRVFGINACLAVHQHRPQAIRKIYLTQSRMDRFSGILTWCAGERIGYRIVENTDLDKLTQSQHHEGVCFETIPPVALTLDELVARNAGKEFVWFAWLDGVGNPHNLGAILRSAAHFGCGGLILHRDALGLSGAACRVAEGGAEVVPIARVDDAFEGMGWLKRRGYRGVATVVRGGDSLFEADMPQHAVLVMGAESEGMSSSLVAACEQKLEIPGSGAVESLNVSAAFAVFAAALSRV